MVLVKRANCECFIAEDKIPEFLALGYSVISKSGEVLQRGKATSKEDLLVEVDALTKENEELKAEVKSLYSEIEALKATGKEFLCPVCSEKFTSKSALTKHLKSKHPDYISE